jgi:thiosulfate/3-mercaptopyruvate sulfurtransferase
MSPLISASSLANRYSDYVVIDCRFDLLDADFGMREYRKSHLPHAAYLHIDHALSDITRKATLGRHPLPTPARFAAAISTLGVTRDSKIVAYDQNTGLYAARLWWLLRAAGFQHVQVLDGGFAAWTAAGFDVNAEAVSLGFQAIEIADFSGMPQIGFDQVPDYTADPNKALLDARTAVRFAGKEEPIDPIAGHIPGAENRPVTQNFADGLFKSPEQLRTEFSSWLAGRAPSDVAHTCGSGITACLQMLAMEHAGLSGSKLFAPSWSGWICDSARPVAVGD